jgi:hypothetical protein
VGSELIDIDDRELEDVLDENAFAIIKYVYFVKHFLKTF